ncbi:unnamed protein product, partial [Meganyctiphanes norvegica]
LQDSNATAASIQQLIQLQNKVIEQQNEERKSSNEKIIQLIDQQNKDRLSAIELYKSLQIIAKKPSNPDCPKCSSTAIKMLFCTHFSVQIAIWLLKWNCKLFMQGCHMA